MTIENNSQRNISPRTALILAGLGSLVTLFTVDVASNHTLYRERDFEHLAMAEPPQRLGKMAVVLAGFGNRNGRSRAGGFIRATNGRVDTAYLNYPQTGINIERSLDAITDVVQFVEPEHLMLYGHSIGGKIANAHSEDLNERLSSLANPPQSLVLGLDCTPFNLEQTAAPKYIVSKLTSTPSYHGGILAKIAATYAGEMIDHGKKTHAHESPLALLKKAINEPSNALLIDQLRYVATLPQFSPVFDKVSYYRPTNPSDDGVVRTDLAVEDWRKIYPDLSDFFLDGSGHASIADTPLAYKEALEQSWVN